MTTFKIRALATGALAIMTVAASARAQTVSSPILNTLEVRTLVASDEPGDHARLDAHFTALAERYEADARRHGAMSRAFVGNPNRRGSTPSVHWKRLAELNAESAETLRELSAHHQQLAAGAPSTAPTRGARFQAGAGAPDPTEAELSALAARARTPADHRALEEYFLTAAKRYTADAEAHVTMAHAYRGTRITQAAAHCDRIVKLAREQAKEATALAGEHAQLANIAR